MGDEVTSSALRDGVGAPREVEGRAGRRFTGHAGSPTTRLIPRLFPSSDQEGCRTRVGTEGRREVGVVEGGTEVRGVEWNRGTGRGSKLTRLAVKVSHRRRTVRADLSGRLHFLE